MYRLAKQPTDRPSSRRKSMPSRSTGSTSSRYILRSAASVSLQSCPERMRQILSCGFTRKRSPSRTRLGAPAGAIALVCDCGMRSRMLLQLCCCIDALREGERAKLSLMLKSDFHRPPHQRRPPYRAERMKNYAGFEL